MPTAKKPKKKPSKRQGPIITAVQKNPKDKIPMSMTPPMSPNEMGKGPPKYTKDPIKSRKAKPRKKSK